LTADFLQKNYTYINQLCLMHRAVLPFTYLRTLQQLRIEGTIKEGTVRTAAADLLHAFIHTTARFLILAITLKIFKISV